MDNIFDDIPENMDQEIFNPLIDSESIKIERIISKGHTSPDSGWYDQDKNEWIIVLQGAAELTFPDGSKFSLKQGDHLNIPAHERHKVSWTAPDTETIWLAVHY
ncbi:MAG: cupin domain-containing protein [Gammaproteobacteria bacterium]|nr:cupin domain-containing protein [Gammaproteobacteria bacterium]MBT8135279.1 cupin domain-containing protein [Gammaproteobacteria bacterium]NNJ49405.1 cupin domain-containing protein [Gammaproteobacteria bacterium]